MEHWAQKCDGAGVDPAEYSKVCRERDELKAALEKSRVPRRQWTYEKRIEAISAAISALREQEELESNLKVLESNRIEGKDTNVPTNTAQRDSNTSNALGGWISVEERLPEEYKRVLVFIPDQSEIVGKPALDTDRIVKGRWVRWGKYVTHWIPLPELPKEV